MPFEFTLLDALQALRCPVLDALAEGFAVTVITDGCRGVNLQPDDSLTAFAEMENAGARLQTAAQFCGEKEQ